MINRRDNNIVSIFSYILNVSQAIFHHQLEYSSSQGNHQLQRKKLITYVGRGKNDEREDRKCSPKIAREFEEDFERGVHLQFGSAMYLMVV